MTDAHSKHGQIAGSIVQTIAESFGAVGRNKRPTFVYAELAQNDVTTEFLAQATVAGKPISVSIVLTGKNVRVRLERDGDVIGVVGDTSHDAHEVRKSLTAAIKVDAQPGRAFALD